MKGPPLTLKVCTACPGPQEEKTTSLCILVISLRANSVFRNPYPPLTLETIYYFPFPLFTNIYSSRISLAFYFSPFPSNSSPPFCLHLFNFHFPFFSLFSFTIPPLSLFLFVNIAPPRTTADICSPRRGGRDLPHPPPPPSAPPPILVVPHLALFLDGFIGKATCIPPVALNLQCYPLSRSSAFLLVRLQLVRYASTSFQSFCMLLFP